MTLMAEREQAIHLLRAGFTVGEVATKLERSERWVRKWRTRFRQEGWAGLQSRSRRPKRLARQLPAHHRQAIRAARSQLEAEAARGEGLKYIGGPAIRTRLREQGLHPLPSVATIERVIREAGMTRPYRPTPKPEVHYPRLQVTAPQTHIQVDIVPHYLKGGQRVACFNAIDVVSRYPTGRAYARRRSMDAEAFLGQVWAELGVPQYTQVDNEGCFSGGTAHPYVLGRVVRLALQAGTELVFSPVYHPQSNGFVERFHRDYNRHVWEATYLDSRTQVQRRGERFFALYRQRPHPRLDERTPAAVHGRPGRPWKALPPISGKRSLVAGRVHFIRRVQADRTITVLNVSWKVPTAQPDQGVWATLELQPSGATLRIFDAAPTAPTRRCLATHPFPLSEPVLPHPTRTAL